MERSLELELAAPSDGSLERSPSRATLASAVRRRWGLVFVLAAIGAGAGVAAGIAAHPTYTDDTQLLVGSPNATVDAVPGFAEATQSLAESYSRAAQSSQVLGPVARRVGLSLDTAAADLVVTPIPDSNIMTVVASGSSSAEARALASAESTELIAFVKTSQAQGGLSKVLAAYRSAATAQVLAQNTVHNLQIAHPKPPEAVYTAAEAALAVAQVRAQALSTEYSSAVQENQAAAGISVLAAPSGATSNRRSTVQKTGIIGLLVGVVLGGLIAFVIEARRARRAIEA